MRHHTVLSHSPDRAEPSTPLVGHYQDLTDQHPTDRWACKVFGHDMTFTAHGRCMTWTCARGCDAGGSKTYASSEEAAHYAGALDKRDNRDLGRRAPLIGLLPLRLWHRLRNNDPVEGSSHVQ